MQRLVLWFASIYGMMQVTWTVLAFGSCCHGVIFPSSSIFQVFLNMLEYKPGELEREPCAKDWPLVGVYESKGTFGEVSWDQIPVQALVVRLCNKPRPPRNRLTNTTPGLLHFNGPSHEEIRHGYCLCCQIVRTASGPAATTQSTIGGCLSRLRLQMRPKACGVHQIDMRSQLEH